VIVLFFVRRVEVNYMLVADFLDFSLYFTYISLNFIMWFSIQVLKIYVKNYCHNLNINILDLWGLEMKTEIGMIAADFFKSLNLILF
jgi:hypothetical protein